MHSVAYLVKFMCFRPIGSWLHVLPTVPYVKRNGQTTLLCFVQANSLGDCVTPPRSDLRESVLISHKV